MLGRHPLRMTISLAVLFCDVFRVGVTSRTARGLAYRFMYAAVLGCEMERRRVDHLHVHFAHVPSDLAMYASSMTGVSFSITGHANDLFERGWLLKKKADRATFFATISNYNRQALIGMGCEAEKVKVVRCGIDPALFPYKEVSQSLGSPLRIGSLGRLVTKKGFHTLLDACPILDTQGVDYQLDIAGDGPLAESLRAQAETNGVIAKTTFLGALSHDKVSEWIRGLDVFVLACCEDENGDVDGIPVVLMEAMAMGVPVVTTAVTGLPELVIDGKTGLVGEPLNAQSIASKLEQIAKNPELGLTLTRQAKAHVDQNFTQIDNAKKLGDLMYAEN